MSLRLILSIFLSLPAAICCGRALGSPGPPAPQVRFDEAGRGIAAEEALAGREGTAIVTDLRRGRILAIVNSRLAFEQAYPPGSAIKPFTALIGLRTGQLTPRTSRRCSSKYERDGFEIACSHPRSDSPFDLRRALAYSCNDYFGHVSERIGQAAFLSTLESFGFGERTGGAALEARGSLPESEWRAGHALGESEDLLVTPIQLLDAFSAMVNGGHLLRPRLPREGETAPSEIRSVAIAPSHRSVLIEAMRDVVEYGTAGRSGLADLPRYIFGKTGTSTSSNGFRTQGWFVGFVSSGPALPRPAEIDLGVLVFLKRSHGAECAGIAARILERAFGGQVVRARPSGLIPATGTSGRVRVRSITEKVTRELPLEDYIAGVLAAESSIENRTEALKAQAVVSRTFALINLGRHSSEGYDFCSTTHCQRFTATGGSIETVRRRAIGATGGEIILDAAGRPAEVYFHAACGGWTANIDTLWGVAAPDYLRGVRDDYCLAGPHRNWSARVSPAALAKALGADPRTDVGRLVHSITVEKYDATGRAQLLKISGERTKSVSGWDFKIIAGRGLGWQAIKSSRFRVAREGGQFVFAGSGFGHGLGLCQEGAHAMAARGFGYRRILGFYFPGTHPGRPAEAGLGQASFDTADHFRISAGSGADSRSLRRAAAILESSREDLLRRLAQASLDVPETRPYEVVFHPSTSAFIAATGQPGTASGATRGRRIELQPLKLLEKRGILETSLRHELAHAVIETISRERAPRWLSEGLAIHFAGEGPTILRSGAASSLTRDRLEKALLKPVTAARARELYRAAYTEVLGIIKSGGERAAWRLAAAYGDPARSRG